MFGHLLTNSYFSVVSPEGSVIILPPGEILTSFNSSMNLTCTAQGGPNNMFEWRKQGVVVSNNSVLELAMITSSDGGTYQCTVTNDAGSGTANVSLIGTCFIILLYGCTNIYLV